MSSVFLRAFEQDDYLLINKWRNDPEIQKMTGGTFRYVSSEMEKEWVRDKMMHNTTDIYLAICVSDESKKMIGYTSINNIDYIHRSAFGGGIVIGDREFRDGIALIDASLLILSHVFADLNLNRYVGTCIKEHVDSRIMMEMMGFKVEGLSREAVYKRNKYHDLYLLSILREEYYDWLNEGEYSLGKIAKRVKLLKQQYVNK